MKPMKHFALVCIAILLASCLIPIEAVSADKKKADENKRNGQILFDFPNAPEPIVEINLTEKLIALVPKPVNAKSEVLELIEMISGIYVCVYDKSDVEIDALITYYAEKLKAENWENLVKINTDSEKIQISLLFDEEVVSGIFISSFARKSEEITFVNIVGEINAERIGELLANLGKMVDVNLDLDEKDEEKSSSPDD